MLSDIERKTLRILDNYSKTNNRMPSLVDLKRKTGRRDKDLLSALRVLVDKHFIVWDGGSFETIRIVQPFEEMPKPRNSKASVNYWMMH